MPSHVFTSENTSNKRHTKKNATECLHMIIFEYVYGIVNGAVIYLWIY